MPTIDGKEAMAKDRNGQRLDFFGCPLPSVSAMLERPDVYTPYGMIQENKSLELPVLARERGLRLISFEPRQGGADPYVLYDARGLKLYEWAEGVIPHWLDVAEVCRRLGMM